MTQAQPFPPLTSRDAQKLAQEWAGKIAQFKGPWSVIAEEVAWGFRQVEQGRHPDAVLKDVEERINARAPKEAPT